jgi:hypothetical protein
MIQILGVTIIFLIVSHDFWSFMNHQKVRDRLYQRTVADTNWNRHERIRKN